MILSGSRVCKSLEKCQDPGVVHNNREMRFGGTSAVCPTLGTTVELAQIQGLSSPPLTPAPILSGPGSPPVALCSLWPTWHSPFPSHRPAALDCATLQQWQGLPSLYLAHACNAVVMNASQFSQLRLFSLLHVICYPAPISPPGPLCSSLSY